MKRKRFSLATIILVLILTTIVGINGVSAQSVCSPATPVSVPFTKDGAGTFCYQATSLCGYINSWNMNTLSINGTNYTNIWVAGSSISPLNGVYTITYVGDFAWSHFEIAGTCGGSSPTNTPVPATNTPIGPTSTRTNTPTGPTNTPAPTATRTNTLAPTNTPVQGSTTYQAESALVGGGNTIDTNHTGYNGSGFVNFSTSGGYVEFQNVNGGSGGTQTLQFRNALGTTSSRTGQLVVNGSTQNITFNPTASWDTWVMMNVVVTLNGGTGNTIRLQSNGQDLANIDEMVVSAGGTSPTNTPGAPTATRTATPSALGSWPTPQGSDQAVTASINVSGVFDGAMRRYYGSGPLGTGGQNEGQDPIFDLAAGATLKNVILGNPAADGVHCAGACTLENVWWEDVGEDAATFRGSSSSLTFFVIGGGARHAADKIFQHNGAGTLTIRNFFAEDFGKLYRSCGNCSTQYQRHVIIQNILAKAPWSAIAGINTNYGDTAQFSQIFITGTTSSNICLKYIGNNTGAEPTQIGSGADGTNCIYSPSDIIYQ